MTALTMPLAAIQRPNAFLIKNDNDRLSCGVRQGSAKEHLKNANHLFPVNLLNFIDILVGAPGLEPGTR